MKPSLKFTLMLVLLFTGAMTLKGQQLINLNPDKNGEPWIAGGLRELTAADYAYLGSLPAFDVPEQFRMRTLPSSLDNSTKPYFRPIFNQDGGSCGQASGIGYAYTYEQDFIRDVAANTQQNQYPTHFTWNFLNGGNGGGSWYFDGWQIVSADGCPNVEGYGGSMWFGGQSRWMSGYQQYYDGMNNRVLGIYYINVSTPEGLQTLKQWFFDHGNGSGSGGVVCFGGGVYGNFQTNTLPSGTPEAGKTVVTCWDASVNHAMTFIGYNDSIRFDYNNDGQYTNNLDINGDGIVDMRDWEIGGVKMANSWGTGWGNSGKAYVMYKTLAEPTATGGIWNNIVHLITTKPSCSPILTMKATVKHTSRNKIKISAGVATDLSATTPEHTISFPLFSYQGGSLYMQGGYAEADKTIELGLDITPLLSYVTPGQTAKYFLQVDAQDPYNEGTGQVISFSVIDYAGASPAEVISSQNNISINENGTIYLTVEKTVSFDAPQILTDALPPATANQPYSFQLNAGGGLSPYTWDLQVDYSEETLQGTFPAITGQPLNPTSLDDGFALQIIDFQFPFYGKLYDTLALSTDGSILFNKNFEYVRSAANLLATRCITPYGADLMMYPASGDGMYYSGDATQATFRWKTSLFEQPEVNIDVAVTLYPSGKIEFFYGNGITPGANWVAGISSGNSNSYNLAAISGTYQIPDNYSTSFISPSQAAGMSVSPDGLFSGTPTQPDQSWEVTFKVTDYNNISSLKTLPFSTSTVTSGQWSNDPAVNNLISAMNGEQSLPKVATHPSGITYISWFSNDNGNYNVKLQKLDVNGNELWPANGILVSGNTADTWITDYDMTVDNDTCALITFQDIRTGLNNAYAYRISPSGEFMYGPNGVALFPGTTIQYSPRVFASSDGNAIFVNQCFPDAGKEYLKMQKISPTGEFLWGPSGINIQETTIGNTAPTLIQSDDDNFIMVWYKKTGNYPAITTKIYAQKFNASGVAMWAAPVGVFTGSGIPFYSTSINIASDNANGVFVSWHAEVSGSVFSSYVQHVGVDGNIFMPANGALVSTHSTYHQIDPTVTSYDNSGEAYVFWDERDYNQNYRGLYGQRISATGTRLWGNTGKVFIPTSLSTSESFITARSTGTDMIVFYQYYDFGNTNDSKMVAMRVNSQGDYVWSAQKIPFCTVQSAKLHPSFGYLDHTQYIIGWSDQRNDGGDIYAQNIHLDGTLGISSGGHTISGTVTYANSENTPLNNLAIDLKGTGGTVIASTTTDASGNYSFTGVASGNYTLGVSSAKAWGGVTAADVLLYKKHIASIAFLTGIYLASGDVNGNGELTAADVLLVKKRIIAIVNSFPVGDWVFSNGPIVVENSNVTANFNGLTYGDANGSYLPPALKQEIISQGFITLDPVAGEQGLVEVPIHLTGVPDLGSFQFTIQYDPGKLVFADVKSWLPGLEDVTLGMPEPGKLTFAWAAGPAGISALDEILCRLMFRSVSKGKSEIRWINDPTPSEFSDFEGHLFHPNSVNGAVGKPTGISGLNDFSWSVYPNPMTSQATLSFVLPSESYVEIGVYDQAGNKSATILSENRAAGKHTITWSSNSNEGTKLSPGIYFCRITACEQTSVQKLVVLP
ncbi:MAG: dockerin type I domain-containing protein [Bacteroidota bacterium]